MKLKSTMLKASSLLYAVFVCVIVALLCGSLILIFSYQSRLNQHYFLSQDLIRASNNHFAQLIDNLDYESINSHGEIKNENDQITTTYTLSKWGLYDILKLKTYIKKDTLSKAALIGVKSSNDRLALYLADKDKPLHIGGKSAIHGDVKISDHGVRIAYISGQHFQGNKLVNGTIGKSKSMLPDLQIRLDSLIPLVKKEFHLEELRDKQLFFNSFHNPSMLVYTDKHAFDNITLGGNMIIHSNDSLFIRKSAHLTDVIIKAPKVVFEKGFSGSVQVIAKNGVHLEEDVFLKYPSSIYVKNDRNEMTEVVLEKGSTVIGGLVLTGHEYRYSLSRLLTIEEDAKLIGRCYCFGKTQLKGQITGTLYTDRFHLKTLASIYENYIVGGIIDKKALPDQFLNVPFFNSENKSYDFIKEL